MPRFAVALPLLVAAVLPGCVARPCWGRTRGFGHERCEGMRWETGWDTWRSDDDDWTTYYGPDDDPWARPGYDGEVAIGWGGTALEIEVYGSGAQQVRFGIAETPNEVGWYGEDCHTGSCHVFDVPGGELEFVDDVNDVIAGRTTLFDESLAFDAAGDDRLTYFVQLDGGPHDELCVVWGHQPSYYAELGCEVW